MKLIKLKARTKKGGYHSAKEYVEAVYKNNKKRIDKAYNDADVDAFLRSPKSIKERFVEDVLASYNMSKLRYNIGERKTRPNVREAINNLSRSDLFLSPAEKKEQYILDKIQSSNLEKQWEKLSRQGRDERGHFTKAPYKMEKFVYMNDMYVQVNANDPHKQLQLVRGDGSLDPWQFREVTI